MNVKTSAAIVLLMNAVAIGVQIGIAIRAEAQPYPGCPFKTGGIYNVCSDNPGVPGLTLGFTLTEGVPGTWGPDGIYTPIEDNR